MLSRHSAPNAQRSVPCRSGEQRGEEAVKALAGLCQRPLPEVNGVAATELFARNKQVDDVNTSRLATLPGPKEPVSPLSASYVMLSFLLGSSGMGCTEALCMGELGCEEAPRGQHGWGVLAVQHSPCSSGGGQGLWLRAMLC